MVFGVILGVVAACLLGCAAGAAVVWSASAQRVELPQPPDTNELVTRLLDANRALLEQERLRATTELDGHRFTSVAGRGRIAGTQFHPEKSGPAGRELLRSFLAWSGDVA